MQLTNLSLTLCSFLLGTMAVPGLLAQSQDANSQTSKLRYTVTDLGLVGGTPGQAFHIADSGLISGAAAAPDGSESAVLWIGRQKLNLEPVRPGGKNGAAFGVNRWGQTVGESDSGMPDPNGEDVCGFAFFGFSSGTECRPVLWNAGLPFVLPTLRSESGGRGPNGVANMINALGVAVGFAENGALDASCPPYSPTTGQTQKLQQKPVFWEFGQVHELPTIASDPAGVALSISDTGFIGGGSGTCSAFDPLSFLNIQFSHAIVWDHGRPIDLGNFGGALGNVAFGVNSHGDAAGASDTAGDTTTLGFLWRRDTGKLRRLLPLASDPISTGLALNDRRDVVGVSVDASFNPHAVIWDHASSTPTDLNTLIPARSGLLLVLACGINSNGGIVGAAVDAAGMMHAYVATPVKEGREEALGEPSGAIELSQDVQETLRKRLAFRQRSSPHNAH